MAIPAVCVAAACTDCRSLRRRFGSIGRDNSQTRSWDTKTIRNGLNFTLTTDLGDINVLGEVAGDETYQTLLAHSFDMEAFGIRFKCIDLPTLIRIKEAAGRRKDLEAIAEPRVLLEEIGKEQT